MGADSSLVRGPLSGPLAGRHGAGAVVAVSRPVLVHHEPLSVFFHDRGLETQADTFAPPGRARAPGALTVSRSPRPSRSPRRKRPRGSAGFRDARRTAGRTTRPGRLRFPERGLVLAVRACLALVLLTPLAGMPWVLYAFTVGKAVYAHTLIAVAFGLWAVLAAARPTWRPRPGILLVLLAATLAAGLVSAFFGVSLQRSLWSNYVRMGGLVAALHWLVFAVLLSAMLRTAADWRRYLNLFLAVGLAAALLGTARFLFPGASDHPWWFESLYPRISGSFANPLFFGAHLQAVALLAAGFLARSFLGAPAPAAARIFWALTAALSVWALGLSGSMGAAAGLWAGAGGAALYFALWGPPGRARLGGRVVFGTAALAGAVLAAALLLDGPGGREAAGDAAAANGGTSVTQPETRPLAPDGTDGGKGYAITLLERITDAGRVGSTFGKRLDTWSAGLQAFADRPLLGWGPENNMVAVSRYDRAAAGTNRSSDRAHNEAMERAVTGGLAGLAAWLLLWAATFAALWRGSRRADPGDGALVVFAGAALLGWLVQGLTSFYSPVTWMQHVLLLACVGFFARAAGEKKEEDAGAGRKTKADRDAAGAWTGKAIATAAACMLQGGFGRPWARGVLAAAAIGLAGASLVATRATHEGAASLYRAETSGPFMAELRNSIRAFEPLATHPRILLFENVAPNWGVIHGKDPARAFRLLAWAEAEERAALAAEPLNWQLLHSLAKMYAAVAKTNPEYGWEGASTGTSGRWRSLPSRIR